MSNIEFHAKLLELIEAAEHKKSIYLTDKNLNINNVARIGIVLEYLLSAEYEFRQLK